MPPEAISTLDTATPYCLEKIGVAFADDRLEA
jgi:hypothetical protein